ncbi:WD40 repeat domain-containing protein [Polyangium jinanense]|uniref:PQQ-binding-like beta-propeller repeat protein n=1 Tax=Polyangium jinanense TaxID=2829994 RepID=A0A9X3X9A4_9BACT|nr:WD40 repeat domain-containing protein [Polyangium jinanense]MDC3984513.1 PQQ-binding-like beta-propeller repeat protein [Polyangium jinanense]
MIFSPDGKTLAVRHAIEGGQFGDEHSTRLYDAASARLLRKVTPKESLDVPWTPSLAISPDGALVACFVGPLGSTVAPTALRLFDVRTGKERAECGGGFLDEENGAIAFSPDNEVVATLSGKPADRSLLVLDAKTCTEQAHFRTRDTTDFVFTDPFHLLTAGANGLELRDRRTGQSRAISRPVGAVYAARFSPDGRYLAQGLDEGVVLVWDLGSTNGPRRLAGHQKTIAAVVFSPDGKTLATAGNDGLLNLWDTATWQKTRTLRGHGEGIDGVAFSPDGKRILTASYDKTARLWDASTGASVWTFPGGTLLTATAFSKDGRRVAIGAINDTVLVLDATTGKIAREIYIPKGGIVSRLFFAGSDALWSWTTHGGLRRWNLDTGESTFEQTPRSKTSFMTASLAPDGNTIVTSSLGDRGAIGLLDAASGKLLRSLKHPVHGKPWHYEMSMSPDGRFLASASPDGSLSLWRTDREQPILTIRAAEGRDAAVVFTEDGYVDFVGPEANSLRRLTLCTVGRQWFPFEVCGERLHVPGLFAKVLKDDSSFREP